MTDFISQLFRDWGELTFGSGLVLAAVFLIAAFVVFPRTILILAAAATFGFKVFPFVMLGGITGSILAFLLARHVAANWVQSRIARYPLLHTVAHAIDEEGWRGRCLVAAGGAVTEFGGELWARADADRPQDLFAGDTDFQHPASHDVLLPGRHRPRVGAGRRLVHGIAAIPAGRDRDRRRPDLADRRARTASPERYGRSNANTLSGVAACSGEAWRLKILKSLSGIGYTSRRTKEAADRGLT